jgi:uridine kinase
MLHFADLVGILPRMEVLLIGGPTCSGKTTLARALASDLHATVMHADDYYRNSDQIESEYSEEYGLALQWDDPAACDLQELVSNLQQLIWTGQVLSPIYSFDEWRRIGWRILTRSKAQPVVVDGLYVLNCKDILVAANIAVFTTYMTADQLTRLKRVKERNPRDRGWSSQEIEKRLHFIRSAERKWILNQHQTADLVLDTTGTGQNHWQAV